VLPTHISTLLVTQFLDSFLLVKPRDDKMAMIDLRAARENEGLIPRHYKQAAFISKAACQDQSNSHQVEEEGQCFTRTHSVINLEG
jgi:hypothetical protein